ncbi:hypothetical protein PsYK624_050050 [Phanerochaete sordida]|uniref:Uncharacterized protein n=1 Tax=Phanerochaete sordida TaxID=48140 RepID=A0A9P3LCI6_9APHY|nr:hypothetical protein PsYK624_050050 [Phanerochaete sordida]
MIAIWLFVLSTVTSSNIYMMCYYYSIWDQRKSILYLLIGVLSVTYLPGIALGLFSTRAYANDVVYVPALDQCILASQTAPTKAFWGCLLAFDVVAIIIGLVNSLDRPYKHRTDVVQSLQRDGAAWFVGIALLRVINFVLGIVMPSTEVLLLAFNAWALINVTLTRLVLRVEELKNPSVESVRVWNLESDMFELRQYSSAPKTSDAR